MTHEIISERYTVEIPFLTKESADFAKALITARLGLGCHVTPKITAVAIYPINRVGIPGNKSRRV